MDPAATVNGVMRATNRVRPTLMSNVSAPPSARATPVQRKNAGGTISSSMLSSHEIQATPKVIAAACTNLCSRCIVTAMFRRGQRVSLANPFSRSAVLALGLVVFAVAASPFCVCAEDHHSSAAAASSEGDHHHSGHHHDQGSKDSDHSCECPALNATMPQGLGQSLDVVPVSFIAFLSASAALHLHPADPVLNEPGVDQDIGPPIPLPRFAILRP